MLKQTLLVFFSFGLYAAAQAQPLAKAKAFYNSGIELKNKNMFPEALEAFNKAIALNKKYDSAYVEAAQLYVNSRNHDNAILYLNKALSISPKMTSALMALGMVYRYSKLNVDSALICFRKIITTDSTNKLALCNMAWCYNSKQDYDNAIIFAIKALDIDNGYKPAYNELGHAYHLTKRYEEGLVQFRKNLAISVVDLPMYYIGMIYIELKDKESAIKQYEELKKINERSAASLKKRIDKM